MLGIAGPESVNEGDTISLTCRYDLERDAIYSMKWFKDGMELYRYIPTDTPKFKDFDTPGIKLESDASRPNMLVFKVDGPLASGEYSCEITVETPTFLTLDRSHNLTVIGNDGAETSCQEALSTLSVFLVPPRLAPAISGIDSYYMPGDLVEINCESLDSKPAPSLEWKLNGKDVSVHDDIELNKDDKLS